MNHLKILNIVLDTNILLVSIPEKSKFRYIYNHLLENKYNLFISNDILKEYEEILYKKYRPDIVEDIISSILFRNNVYPININFNWNLISADPDDNKFVDCAIAGNVDYIVTNDKHFDVLKNINFPKVNVINVDEFKKLLE